MESHCVGVVLVFALAFLVYDASSAAEEPVMKDIRLVDGSQPHEGRVELLVNGTWGTICDDRWDDQDAQVVCRQLGYDPSGATAYTSAFFQQGYGPVYLTDMNCAGRESSIFDCPKLFSYRRTDCQHSEDAGVSCIEPILEDIRLVDGSQPHEGRVELLVNGTWGTICDDRWDDQDARVVCRQLGYDTSGATAYTSAFFQQGYGPVYLANMNCAGIESSIFDCPKSRPFRQTGCSHKQDAGVSCVKPVLKDIRLVDGSQPHEGRVELLVNGTWGTICDVSWDDQDAQVVCRQLGYDPSEATAYTSAFFKQGYGPVYLASLHCVGRERSIFDCPKSKPFRQTGCMHNEDAGVSCIKPVLKDIRLVDGSQPHEGRVELLVNGTWGTICDDGWDDQDAQVVCRQLGYDPFGVTAYSSAFFQQGYGPVYLATLNCAGTERSILECPKSKPFRQTGCAHSMDAGVSCIKPVLEDIRLVDGSQPHEGRVELLVNGTWGTICDDEWNYHDAQVVCRQLGYDPSEATAYTSAFFQQGYGPVYLASLHCVGRERSIFDCPKSKPFRQTGCNHKQDAGVSCIKPVLEEIRLVDGSQPHEGRVELLVNGTWGTICDDLWGDRDAQVVCRQLGYDPSEATAYTSAFFQQGYGPVYLASLHCVGRERSILDCLKSKPFRQTGCMHTEDAGVSCIKPVLRDIRLVDGSQPHEGRVELLVNGTWGTICDDDWDDQDAQVVCRQLGYDPSEATAYTSAFFQQGYGPVYLASLHCVGTERSIFDCRKSKPFRQTGCNHNEDAGVSCIKPVLEDIRLVDGSQPHEGRVELLVNGTWGTICDDGWDNRDAQVVCRQLGYDPYGATAYRYAAFNAGSGPIYLTYLKCVGSETDILRCPKSYPFKQVSCSHSDDASVTCSNKCSSDLCSNGGVCVNSAKGVACQCPVGFTGRTCESDIDKCTTNPCGDNGVCNDTVNGHTCTCYDGTTGLSCQPPGDYGDSGVAWKATSGVLALVLTLCAIVAVFCIIRKRRLRDKGQASGQATRGTSSLPFDQTLTVSGHQAHSQPGVQPETRSQPPSTTVSTYTGYLQIDNLSSASCSQGGYETTVPPPAVDESAYSEIILYGF